MKHAPRRTLPWALAFASACARGPAKEDPNSEAQAQQGAREEVSDAGADKLDSDLESAPRDEPDPDARPEPDATRPPLDGTPAADVSEDAAGSTFSFTVSNVDPASLDLANAPTALLDCGVTRVDTSDPLKLDNWCGSAPTPLTRTQTAGPELVVLALDRLSVAAGSSLVITGTRPALVIVRGDADVRGAIDVSANGSSPGPGANLSCGASSGGDGAGRERLNGGGGGGGGFGTAGGPGGDDRGDSSAPGEPGRARGVSALVPLIAGCAGGRGGGCAGEPGAGGGALQLTVGGALLVSGSLHANGGDGAQGCSDDAGGTGGGSGGALLLEAQSIDLSGATISANGGAGGPGQRQGAPGAGARSASEQGAAGQAGRGNGAGGGGGGFGLLELRAATTCTGCDQP